MFPKRTRVDTNTSAPERHPREKHQNTAGENSHSTFLSGPGRHRKPEFALLVQS